MPFEPIDTILRAEEQAAALISDAHAEARRLLAEEESAGSRRLREAEEEAARTGRSLLEEAERDAASRAGFLASQAEKAREALRKRAESRMSEAAALITERIVKR